MRCCVAANMSYANMTDIQVYKTLNQIFEFLSLLEMHPLTICGEHRRVQKLAKIGLSCVSWVIHAPLLQCEGERTWATCDGLDLCTA